METGPASVNTTRASGVVSMAFANTGLVSLCTIFSKMFPPGGNDLVKVLEDDLADLASQTRRTVVLELLQDVEALWLQQLHYRDFSAARCHGWFVGIGKPRWASFAA